MSHENTKARRNPDVEDRRFRARISGFGLGSSFRFRVLPCILYSVCCILLLSCHPSDTTPPTVSFLSPQDSDTLYAGQIKLRVEAHDNIEVTSVKFLVDGKFIDSTGLSLTDTFEVLWDATAETLDVTHVLEAEARDRARNAQSTNVAVLFRREIPPGALSVTTTPPGAAIWIDGTNSGKTTPATVESLAPGPHQVKLTLAHYGDLDTSVEVFGGQTAQLTASLYGYAAVSGTVTWPGHTLSPACVALLDTSIDGSGAYILYGPVNSGTGEFSLAARLSLADSVYVLGFDDVDGNRYPSSGDGQGFWDYNGDQQMTLADMVRIAPGDTISNAQVVLVQLP